MQGRAASIVSLVDIHFFDVDEVVEWTRLIALSCYVQNVGAIDVLSRVIYLHFFDHETDQLYVSVVCSEVKSGESLVRRHIYPLLDSFPSL